MNYRPEIDGLRAVAVIPVILFHAGLTIFSGGYIGVDVFFVISGYLITRIIITELDQGSFSILRFYERRARRILPALFFVMLCCLPFAWFWMLPAQFKDFSQSLVAVIFFASNMLFWRESGYFAATSEQKPLLHTWSLAVEEQYYVFFPITLILLWKFGRNPVFFCVIVLSTVSFLMSEWGWRNYPAANFYFAPMRAWELLAGSICAFLQYGNVQKSSNALSAVGLFLIVGSVFYYDEGTPFPSVYALAPVGGTMLVILYGQSGTLAAQILSFKACTGIGVISYSAYLWHQPLFAFARIRSVGSPEQWLMMLLAVVSLGLAYLSWRYIEQPFRKRPIPALRSRGALFGTAGLVSIAFVAFGFYGHVSDGLKTRASIAVPFAELGIEKKIHSNHGLHAGCESAFKLTPKCISGDPQKILLWGDSYAMHLAQALTAGDETVPIRQHTLSACPPLLGTAQTDAQFSIKQAKACIAFNDQVYDWMVGEASVEYVVLSSKFSILSSNIYARDGSVISENQFEAALSRMKDTITQITNAGKKPIVISPPPNNGSNLGMCLFSVMMFDAPRDSCDFARSEYSNSTLLAYRFMERISGFAPVLMLDDLICDDAHCDTMIGDAFLYRDEGHLAKEGSHRIGATHSLSFLLRTHADAFWER